MGPSLEKAQGHQVTRPLPQPSSVSRIPLSSSFPVALNPIFAPLDPEKQAENLSPSNLERLSKPICPIPILPVPPSSKMAALNLNKKGYSNGDHGASASVFGALNPIIITNIIQ